MLTRHDIRSDGLVLRWQEAQERCREQLRPTERDIINSFETPQQLEADLRDRQQSFSNSTMNQLIAQVHPCLETFSTLSTFFLAAMQPRLVETTVIWGTLYLSLKVSNYSQRSIRKKRRALASKIAVASLSGIDMRQASLGSQDTLAKIVYMLNKIRKELVLFATCATRLSNRAEVQHALVDMFVALINFWVEVVSYLRKTPGEHFVMQAWPSLSKRFKEAVEEIDTAVEHVHKLASFEQLQNDRDHTMARAIDLLDVTDEAHTSFPCYDLPPTNPNFLGRETELREMEAFLQPETCSKVLSSCVIHGLGGIGKSSLALAFAGLCQQQNTFEAIFWIRGENLISLRNSYSDMAIRLELTHASNVANIDNNVVRFRNWLNKTTPGPVILTTRFSSLAFAGLGRLDRIELSAFGAEQSMQLFKKLRRVWDKNADLDGEEAQMAELLSELGGLSLAIEQMSAYIGTRGLTMAQFLVKYKRMSKHILKTHDADDPERASKSHSVATVWEMHFEAIRGSNASEILAIMSILSPDAIPIDLFLPEDGVDTLVKNALIKRSGNFLSLHRLVQKAYQDSVFSVRNGDFQKTWVIAVQLVNQAYPSRSYGGTITRAHEECAKYLPHAVALTDIWNRSQGSREPLQPSSEFTDLINKFTTYEYEMGLNIETLEYLEIGFRATSDKESDTYAQMKETAGKTFQDINDPRNCQDACYTALAIFDKLYQPDNLYSAVVNCHLGNASADEGAYDEALRFHERSAAVQVRAGKDALENLALNYLSMGRLYFLKVQKERARELFQLATDAFNTGGSEVGQSPYAASLLRGKADLKFSDGYPEQALEIINKAIVIYESISQISGNIISYYYKKGYFLARLDRVTFNKGLGIAEHREDLGEQARILRQRGLLVKRDPGSSDEDRVNADHDIQQAALLSIRLTERAPPFAFPPRSEDEAYNSGFRMHHLLFDDCSSPTKSRRCIVEGSLLASKSNQCKLPNLAHVIMTMSPLEANLRVFRLVAIASILAVAATLRPNLLLCRTTSSTYTRLTLRDMTDDSVSSGPGSSGARALKGLFDAVEHRRSSEAQPTEVLVRKSGLLDVYVVLA
nr:hypothetical protein CFP56_09642 [Quercus suber]